MLLYAIGSLLGDARRAMRRVACALGFAVMRSTGRRDGVQCDGINPIRFHSKCSVTRCPMQAGSRRVTDPVTASHLEIRHPYTRYTTGASYHTATRLLSTPPKQHV